jgi:glycosyltransferase involved in cell wall biosynthesis
MAEVVMSAKLKVVWLCDRRYHETKMSRCRFEYARAIQRHPDVECLFTGPGIMGYDDGLSVSENLKRLQFAPEIVLAYKPLDMVQFRELKAIKTIAFNECYWSNDQAAKEAMQAGVDFVICHHRCDLPRFHKFNLDVIHIPHAVNPTVFTAGDKASERQIPLLVTGELSEDIYPLRTRVANLVRCKMLPGKVRRHPGYKLGSVLECEQQYANYAEALRSAKIVFVCGSKYKLPLAKYFEAFASGSLVMGDLPDDSVFQRAFSEWLVQFDMTSPPEEIIKSVNWFLSHPEAMDRLAAGGCRAAQAFTTTEYAEKFVDKCRKTLFF